jgi:3-oxoacyl-[acyl-carrier-protein] synthase-3
MSFLSIPNVKITGFSACVPKQRIEVKNFHLFKGEEAENFSKTTGVITRRIASESTTSSDLCFNAAELLIQELGWDKNDIDCLIFVTQTPDYQIPATSPILQNKLGLSSNCYTLDISLGCSGWIYGLSVISSLLSHGFMKKGLLLVGDTLLKTCSLNDKSTFPLFGDAGSATALEFNEEAKPIHFHLMSDGDGSDVINIKDGGYRNPVNESSFNENEIGVGVNHSNLQLHLEGMDVFTFGISKAPKSINQLISRFDLDSDNIDFYTMHQANRMMNEKIKFKLKIPAEKYPYSLNDFGNTSCASIPVTYVTQLQQNLKAEKLKHIACGFGVGLSWGSVYFETDNIVVSDLIEI